MQVVKGKCSHCGRDESHVLERRNSIFERSVYRCRCGEFTIRCRTCSGMAKYSSSWADELCAEHFSEEIYWTNGDLDCISDWPSLWAHKPGIIRRIASFVYPVDAVESFSIHKLSSGSSKGCRVIYVNGFLGQSDDQFSDWQSAGLKLFPDTIGYGLRWESRRIGTLQDVAGMVSQQVLLAWKTAGLSAIAAWYYTSLRAADTGRLLAQILMRAPGQKFILCGHSLGARVIFYALNELAEKKRDDVVQAVHLMGGAVGVGDVDMWKRAVSVCQGGIANYYSLNDEVLKLAYIPAMGFRSDPIGRNSLHLPGVRNYDVSSDVAGHTAYKDQFSSFARFPLGL